MLPPAPSHRILIVTDAWLPQVNGVVRTLTTVAEELRAMGHVVEVIGPDRFRTFPCPTYPDIALSVWPRRRLIRMIEAFAPDALHIATEGPLGLAARRWARQARRGVHHRVPHSFRRVCAGPAAPADAADLRLDAALSRRGFGHHGGHRQPARGTACARFPQHPGLVARRGPDAVQAGAARGLGSAAVRSSCTWAGWRWRRISPPFWTWTCRDRRSWWAAVPQLEALRRDYPQVRFTGPRYGEALARAYAGADVFVFPSLTDTFGLVILEALACGTPVAAFPVTGPKDVLADSVGKIGAVNADLRLAALAALDADRAACRAHAERYSWRACAEIFLSHLVPITGVAEAAVSVVTAA